MERQFQKFNDEAAAAAAEKEEEEEKKKKKNVAAAKEKKKKKKKKNVAEKNAAAAAKEEEEKKKEEDSVAGKEEKKRKKKNILAINAGCGQSERWLHKTYFDNFNLILTDIDEVKGVEKLSALEAVKKYYDDYEILLTVWPNHLAVGYEDVAANISPSCKYVIVVGEPDPNLSTNPGYSFLQKVYAISRETSVKYLTASPDDCDGDIFHLRTLMYSAVTAYPGITLFTLGEKDKGEEEDLFWWNNTEGNNVVDPKKDDTVMTGDERRAANFLYRIGLLQEAEERIRRLEEWRGGCSSSSSRE
uniref:Uncharacterized protein n=1 Tax=Carcinus maenas virus 1 TaxID=2704945 RepID=A0A6G9HDB0_9VIRU|nr:hypothetical protein [Carcinus maenas virus 1]